MHRKTEACGLLFTSMGNHFLLEWPDRQLVEMSRSASNFDACSKGRLLLMEPDKSAFVNSAVMMATEEALRRKAEAKHIVYTAVPVESLRYRFVALNEMGRMLVMRQHAV